MRLIIMSDFRSTSTSGLPLSRKTPFNLPVETKKQKKVGVVNFELKMMRPTYMEIVF